MRARSTAYIARNRRTPRSASSAERRVRQELLRRSPSGSVRGKADRQRPVLRRDADGLAQQILALMAAGADTFVVFATPTPTITALVTATKGRLVADDVHQQRVGEPPLPAGGSRQRANVDGSSPRRTSRARPMRRRRTRSESSSQRRSSRSTRRAPDELRNRRLEHHVRAEQRLGVRAGAQEGREDLTRAGLMFALRNMNMVDPFTYPGIKIQTGPHDAFPIEQEILIKWAVARRATGRRSAALQRRSQERAAMYDRGASAPLSFSSARRGCRGAGRTCRRPGTRPTSTPASTPAASRRSSASSTPRSAGLRRPGAELVATNQIDCMP